MVNDYYKANREPGMWMLALVNETEIIERSLYLLSKPRLEDKTSSWGFLLIFYIYYYIIYKESKKG